MLEIELLSGRSDVVLGQFQVDHMASLYNAQKYDIANQLVGTIQKIVNVDLHSMLFEDFKSLLAMIDKTSWTDGHRIFEWRCSRPYYATMNGQRHYERPTGRRFEQIDCKALNTEELPRTRVKMSKLRTLPDGMVYPTVGRWLEAHSLKDAYGSVPFDVMWIDSDLPLKQTIDLVPPDDLIEVRRNKHSCVEIELNLTCNSCLRKYRVLQDMDALHFLRVLSEESVMTMTHDIAVHRKVMCPPTFSIKELFYWHGMLIKDLQKQAEKIALEKGKRG